jgi:hypothetical protein
MTGSGENRMQCWREVDLFTYKQPITVLGRKDSEF